VTRYPLGTIWPRKSGEPAGCVNTATGSNHRKTEAKMGENNWAATAARIETILDCLTNRAVSMTVSMDRGAAKRAVEYCQHRAAGADEDTDAEAEIIEFLAKHEQSYGFREIDSDGIPSKVRSSYI
jgi:hypothetical protein